MANETKRVDYGGGMILIDTEVTSGGEYPVMGKGIYSAIGDITPSEATASKAGLVKQAANVASVEEVTAEAFNSLLTALKTAGIMVADA